MPTLKAQAYRHIRKDLLSGRWESGEKLSELKLAGELGVSRNPVREALLELASEGLLERTSGLGCRVPAYDIESVNEMYQLREALEGQAARLACDQISRAQCKELADLAEAISSLVPSKDDAELRKADNRFHRRLVELSGNRTLLRSWEVNHVRVVNVNDTFSDDERGQPTPVLQPDIEMDGHSSIVVAVMGSDPEEAEAAAREHVRSALADITDRQTGHGTITALRDNVRSLSGTAGP